MSNRIQYKKGDVFGTCLFISDEPIKVDSGGSYRRTARFQCKCGNEFVAILHKVKIGETSSCGCYKSKSISERKFKHGGTAGEGMPEFNIWVKMRQRCNSEKDKAFKNYGGRGIKVCNRWLNSFENFLSDMGRRPSPEHSLERKNNNRGYSKNNCKWATIREQSRNRRNNVKIKYNGETKILADWAEHFGIPYMLLYKRLRVFNWTPQEAFTTKDISIREKRYLHK